MADDLRKYLQEIKKTNDLIVIKKKVSTNSTGYDVVSEAIDEKDFRVITKLIRNVVGDILRDIWLKRSAWK